ncbi:hypothetical protein [Lentzea sp. CA-135723]|uniref:hypothetical protein n=1 Tax=Lentzea sp. CA-135723 TaxID=3239950 RepID=UPI003D910E3F
MASAATALFVARMQRRKSTADAFLHLSARFELPEFRRYRVTIYRLDRERYDSWAEEEKEAVDAWCAHIDLIAVLTLAGQLDRLSLLNMYGDVIMRTLYQIAPYCNAQIKHRGGQFLLPARQFTSEMVLLWRRQAAKKRYPLTIGFPSQPMIKANPDLFDSDDHIADFRIDGVTQRSGRAQASWVGPRRGL